MITKTFFGDAVILNLGWRLRWEGLRHVVTPIPRILPSLHACSDILSCSLTAFRLLVFVPPCAAIACDACGILYGPMSGHIGLGFAKPPKPDWIAYTRCLPTFSLEYRTCGHGLGLATFVVLFGVFVVVCDVCLQTLLAHWRRIRSY